MPESSLEPKNSYIFGLVVKFLLSGAVIAVCEVHGPLVQSAATGGSVGGEAGGIASPNSSILNKFQKVNIIFSNSLMFSALTFFLGEFVNVQ